MARTLLFLLGFLLSLSSLSPALTSAEDRAPVKLGALLGLTGDLAVFGEEARNALLLAAEDSQAWGRTPLQLTFSDIKFNTKEALASLTQLTQSPRSFAFFVQGSGPVLAIKPMIESRKLLLFTSAAHSEILTGSQMIIRHSNLTGRDVRVMAEGVLSRFRPKRVAIVAVENEWAAAYASELVSELDKSGVHASIETFPPGESNFRSLLLRTQSSRPDLYVISAFGAAAGEIVRQAGEIGIKQPLVPNIGFVLSPDSMAIAKRSIYTRLLYQDYPEMPVEFVGRYQKAYGKLPGYLAVAAYTDGELLSKAASEVGVAAPDMARYIRRLGHFNGRYEKVAIGEDGEITIPTRLIEISLK